MRRALPTILHGVSVVAVCTLCFATRARVPFPSLPARMGGSFVIVVGATLVLWAVSHIRAAVLGLSEPRRASLLTSGPYRLMRHPIYAGFALVLLGLAVATRSAAGLAAVVALLIPSEIYRAREEEKALRRRFGSEWQAYSRRTGFFLPLSSGGGRA